MTLLKCCHLLEISAEHIHLNVFTRNGTIMLLVIACAITVVACVLQLNVKKIQYYYLYVTELKRVRTHI